MLGRDFANVFMLSSIGIIIFLTSVRADGVTVRDLFDAIDKVNDEKINLDELKKAVEEFEFFKYLKTNKARYDEFIGLFNKNCDNNGQMDKEKFVNTYSSKYILTIMLPEGKTLYDKKLLTSLFGLTDKRADEFLNGKINLTIEELVAKNDSQVKAK